MKEQKDIMESISKLYFDYACRALLGGGKGTTMMAQLYKDNKQLYFMFLGAAKKCLIRVDGYKLETIEKGEKQLEAFIRGLKEEGGD